jgi:hypothetical protein
MAIIRRRLGGMAAVHTHAARVHLSFYEAMRTSRDAINTQNDRGIKSATIRESRLIEDTPVHIECIRFVPPIPHVERRVQVLWSNDHSCEVRLDETRPESGMEHDQH